MHYTKDEENLIVADTFGELNYTQKKYFLASVKGTDQSEKYKQVLIKSCAVGVYNKLYAAFRDESYRGKVLGNLERKRVCCVTVKSKDYPESLKNTPAPPLCLYCRGNINLLQGQCFGVVGSRKTDNRTLAECKKIASVLAKKLVIVTGIACGADSAAIEGALPSGNLICVLPCGHGGGAENSNPLVGKVEKAGLTVSEYPLGFKAQRYTFLVRNRIIAGLSLGVLVTSAAKRSGALSTASYAADYGREVFAFPHEVNFPQGVGCNALIKKGASLCDGAQDIFSALGIDYRSGANASDLSKEEAAVLKALKENGEMHLEQIAKAVDKPVFEITIICSSLEIKKLAVRTGGNKFAAL